MKKRIKFLSKDRKIVKLDISITKIDGVQADWETLEKKIGQRELSISGECGGSYGQIYDSFIPTDTQKELVDFWKENHLNTLTAGTRRQHEYLKSHGMDNDSFDYTKACEILEEGGLLEDRGYRFGSGWLYRSIDEPEFERIVAAVEQEETARLEANADKSENFDIDEDSEELFEAVSERFPNTDPEVVVALMRMTETPYSDIDIVTHNYGCVFDVGGSMYYCGLIPELEDMAREYLDKDMWVDSVRCGETELGYSDWVEEVISEDLGSALGSYDGTIEEYEVNGTCYYVCQVS